MNLLQTKHIEGLARLVHVPPAAFFPISFAERLTQSKRNSRLTGDGMGRGLEPNDMVLVIHGYETAADYSGAAASDLHAAGQDLGGYDTSSHDSSE